MRTVVDNATAAHMWANQTQAYANRSGTGGSLSFSGRKVYSYTTCMGVILPPSGVVFGGTVYLLNSHSYSVTTGKHQSMIWRACRGSSIFRFPFPPTTDVEANIRKIRGVLEYELESIPGFNKDGKSGKRRDKALAEFANSVEYANEFVQAVTGETGKFNDLMAPDAMAALLETRDRLKREEEATQAEKQRQYEIESAERLEKWLDGQDVYGYFLLEYARLRVKGSEVQTTQGATVPLEHVLKALPLVLRLLNSGGTYKRNGHTIHLGHYAIDEIAADGVLVAGCHKFTKAEILRFAGAIPTLYERATGSA